MQFLKIYIKKYWKPFSAAVLFLTVEALCDLMQPTIMAHIVDIGVAQKRMDYIISMGGLMLLITGIGAIGAVGRNILSSNVSQNFGRDLRSDLFKKIQGLSFENLDKFENASLVIRLTNDITQVQNFVNGLMRIFAKAPILCIGSIIMAVRLNPRMSVVLVVIIPIIVLIISLNLKISFPFFMKVQTALDKLNSVMREYLIGVRVVKAFNRFDFEKKRFEKANQEQAKASSMAMKVMSAFSPGITLTVNLGIVAVLWYGGINVKNGNMYVGQIIAFINYMTQILFSLMMVAMVFNNFVRAKASAERINSVFIQENANRVFRDSVAGGNDEMNDKLNTGLQEKNIKGRVDFEHVYFSYNNASGESVMIGKAAEVAYLIKDISLTCMPGETIGIIGSTGSGKSTLVNLIPAFYDVTKGIIRVDGIDIKDMPTKALRGKIALVPQKTTLFSGSVIDNIRWGKEDATNAEVEEAAKVAQAHNFVLESPEGYNSIIGQGGVNFSGGQKQRLSIARALVKRPEVLILDDCTSAVDVATEIKIREALKEYAKDLTLIIIAERITSVMDADKILVLEDGSAVGLGSHKDLLENCKVYKDIFLSQFGGDTLE